MLPLALKRVWMCLQRWLLSSQRWSLRRLPQRLLRPRQNSLSWPLEKQIELRPLSAIDRQGQLQGLDQPKADCRPASFGPRASHVSRQSVVLPLKSRLSVHWQLAKLQEPGAKRLATGAKRLGAP